MRSRDRRLLGARGKRQLLGRAVDRDLPKIFHDGTGEGLCPPAEGNPLTRLCEPAGNGPERSGEGWLYRGRGPLQETGRANYAEAGAALGIDLVADPDSTAYPPLGFQIALNRWPRSKLNSFAAKGPTHAAILACSRGINLGNPLSRAQPNGFAVKAGAIIPQ